MRAIAAALAVLLVLTLAPAAGSAGAAGLWLPAPITVQTSAGTFEIGRDGHVGRIVPRASALPRDAAVFPSGVWYVIRGGHLEVGRGARTLWRSRGEFPARFQIGVVTIAARTVAFSYRRGGGEQLYVARLGHHTERRIAGGEFPLGWAGGGFYTYRYRGRELRFRADTGALVATLVRRVSTYEYDSTSRRLYFVNRARLLSAGGAAPQPIALLKTLGLRARPAPALIPAAGLVELLGSNRLVVLRANGSPFGSAPIALSRENISSSSVAIARSGNAVAYTVLSGPQPGRGVETLYVLRAGAHAAIPLHRQRIANGGCERGAGVQWHGHWLLYTTSEGYLAVVDAAGTHRTIDLTPIVRSLPGHTGGIGAYWTGQAPAL